MNIPVYIILIKEESMNKYNTDSWILLLIIQKSGIILT